MITSLTISNIAVIESAEIEFTDGLNVLTGETGAGKSIIIDSINAVLGNRTSRELVRSGADSALVTAAFRTKEPLSWLDENEIPQSDELIISRRIHRDGKNSCRINGVPVTAAQLRELATQLVDIHGQNDGVHLLDEKAHLAFLDGFLPIAGEIEVYKTAYRKLAELGRAIKALKNDAQQKEFRLASLKSTVAELEKAKLSEGEYESAKARYTLLSSSGKLREHLERIVAVLTDSDASATSSIASARYDLQKVAGADEAFKGAEEKLNDADFKLKDVSETARDFLSDLDYSEEEFNRLEERISQLEHLMRKYSADESGLITLLDESRKSLLDLESSDDRIELLSWDFDQQKEKCLQLAEVLSERRKQGALRLQEEVTKELRDLNMKSVRFLVDFQTLPKLSVNGMDDVRFLMSANAGETPGRISKIASGGELSRIMLALKNVFARNDAVDTLIFDEIDSGVSGISAQKVGEKLYNVSKYKQVMCITHLPQIASMADEQYLVRKEESGGRTYTEVNRLEKEERIGEIARLYGGERVTEVTRAAAEEQLNASEAYKKEKNNDQQ